MREQELIRKAVKKAVEEMAWAKAVIIQPEEVVEKVEYKPILGFAERSGR